jgi:hypothetical protein
MRSAWLEGFRDGWQLEIVATKLDIGLHNSVRASTVIEKYVRLCCPVIIYVLNMQ